jgi:hypothetical protein
MRIDTSGNLLVGTASTLGAKFALYGTAAGTNPNIQITSPGIGTACIGLTGEVVLAKLRYHDSLFVSILQEETPIGFRKALEERREENNL